MLAPVTQSHGPVTYFPSATQWYHTMGDMRGNVYRCSDGRWYGDTQIWERFERGVWTPCCWDTDTGTEWVETVTGALLELRPISQQSLPADVTVTHVAAGIKVDSPRSVKTEL